MDSATLDAYTCSASRPAGLRRAIVHGWRENGRVSGDGAVKTSTLSTP